MPVTIKDVAKASGMSVPAVCQILNGKASYRAESIKRVNDAVRHLGYQPNAHARAMKQGRFGSCALVLPPGHEAAWLPRGLLKGLESTLSASASDTHLVIAHLPDLAQSTTDKAPKILSQWMADGLIIVDSPSIPSSTLTLLKRNRMPCVWLNIDHPFDAVRPDDRAAGLAATEILLKRGHRSIAFVDYSREEGLPSWHYSNVHRWEGYEQAMIAAGLHPRFIGGNIQEGAQEFSRVWLRRKDRPTAVVVYEGGTVAPILLGMAYEGLHPARDLSLITFCDDTWVGRMSLDALVIPGRAIGEAAALMLQTKIAKRVRCPTQPIAMSYSAGSTVGAPQEGAATTLNARARGKRAT